MAVTQIESWWDLHVLSRLTWPQGGLNKCKITKVKLGRNWGNNWEQLGARRTTFPNRFQGTLFFVL